MTDATTSIPVWLRRWEAALVTAAWTAAFVSVPLLLGQIGLSWDALNHHFYLGWTAEQPRFDQDYLAASYQAYQFPYLYWPVYRLGMAGLSGAAAGAVLALLPALAIPAVWKIARACVPGDDWFGVAMRSIAVALAFAGGVTLSMLDTTGNDLTAAVPLVWAIALALEGLSPSPRAGVPKKIWLSGLLAGVSVAFKLSNGPIAIVLPVLWAATDGTPVFRLRCALAGGLCAVAGFLLAYGYWGWQLWEHFGNPFYPLYDHWFQAARTYSGWHR